MRARRTSPLAIWMPSSSAAATGDGSRRSISRFRSHPSTYSKTMTVCSVLAAVDDRDDVRMRERHARSCLAAEALDVVVVAGELQVEDLQRDPRGRALVVRPEDARHPSCAHKLLELVAVGGCPGNIGAAPYPRPLRPLKRRPPRACSQASSASSARRRRSRAATSTRIAVSRHTLPLLQAAARAGTASACDDGVRPTPSASGSQLDREHRTEPAHLANRPQRSCQAEHGVTGSSPRPHRGSPPSSSITRRARRAQAARGRPGLPTVQLPPTPSLLRRVHDRRLAEGPAGQRAAHRDRFRDG